MTHRILLSTGVSLCYLIFEWWLIRLGHSNLSQIDLTKALLALAIAGCLIGLGGGLFATWTSAWLRADCSALAFPLALMVLLEMFAAQNATLTGIAIVSSLACGVLTFIAVYSVVPRLPDRLTEFPAWWLVAMIGFSFSLALTVTRAPDATGIAAASLGSLISGALAVVGFFGRTRDFRLSGLGFSVLIAAGALIVFHYPTVDIESSSDSGRPSVLLFTVDTLRADHVGAYGYRKARTPNLDSLANEGVLFKQTVTANAYTGPSHASILTGLLPVNHGVVKNRVRIPPTVLTLADQLKDHGYATAAFVSSYTTEDSASGLPSRFAQYDDDIRAVRWLSKAAFNVPVLTFVEKVIKVMGWHRGEFDQSYRQAAETADIAVEWFEHNGNLPYFVWVHFFDPHIPYRPPQKYVDRTVNHTGITGDWYGLSPHERADIVNSEEKVAAMIDLYDAEIAYTDHELGRILEAARKYRQDGNLIVIAASDHGESMGEHQIYWERELYDPTALVPLIVQAPERYFDHARVVDAQVRLIDIAPTIMDLLELESAQPFDGQSLTRLLRGESTESTGPAVSEKFPIKAVFPEIRSVRTDQWKYLQRFPGSKGDTPRGDPLSELYHLPSDKQEMSNLVGSGRDIPEGFDELLEAKSRATEPEEMDLSPEDRARLRSLGYIQ